MDWTIDWIGQNNVLDLLQTLNAGLPKAVYNHWTGLVDWTGGLDWWTDTKNHFYAF